MVSLCFPRSLASNTPFCGVFTATGGWGRQVKDCAPIPATRYAVPQQHGCPVRSVPRDLLEVSRWFKALLKSVCFRKGMLEALVSASPAASILWHSQNP